MNDISENTVPNGAFQPQVNPYAGQQTQLPPRLPRRKGTSRDLIMAVCVGVVCFVLTDCLVWAGGLGLGFAAGAVCLLVTALWYLKPVRRHMGFYTVACMVLFAAGSVSFVFSADTFTKVLTLFCLMILYVCMLMDGMQLRQWAAGTFRSIGDFFYTAFGASFGKIGAGMYGLFRRDKSSASGTKKGVGKALLGLAIALPVSAVLILLLSSADEAFHGMLSGFDLGKIFQKPVSLFLAVPVFIVLFSQLFSLRDIQREERQESGKGWDPTVLTFFLLGISAVYIAYLFSQLAYFFSGFMGFLPEEFTYAQYARRGFFELTAVSVINIVIVILGTAFTKKKEGKLLLRMKLPCLFLCLFSLLLTATEITKMKMYADAYGLTRLRILTTLFMIFLAVVFVGLIVHLFAGKFPYLKLAVIAGAVLTIAVSFVSVDRMVAEYNVWAYQSGALKTLDVDTITELGDAAVPALLKIADGDDPTASSKAKKDLYRRWEALHVNEGWEILDEYDYNLNELSTYDWRGFNTVSYTARRLLLQNGTD